jgi:hypothetical protein
VTITSLTLAELKARHADLVLQAERERARWRGMVATSPHAAAAGRRVKDLDRRALDYETIIGAVA